MLPSSVAFMVLSGPIVTALFAGGKFDGYSVTATANALLFYSIGLSAYAVTKILQGAFFSLHDTGTPTRVSALGLGLNIALNLLLMHPMRLSGLALATSLSGCICSCVLAFLLSRRIGGLGLLSLGRFFARVCVASSGMGLVCFWSVFFLRSSGVTGRIAIMAVPVLLGLVSFLGLSLAMGIKEVKQLGQWLFRRRPAGEELL
jgi:putative peptidoglycan lipid II flippase